MKKGRASSQNKEGVWSQKCFQDVCEEILGVFVTGNTSLK